ncbi:MAG TPA: alpha/beta fold hydrolase [Amaricoccus sp.]|uniref:alpha/beta fold hydrolase n=1 Tax=Amaricoccus sp. TaxID=1872485 RepID=UPI002C951862|nr:alpha/beta fold hydrolase [Amaricoccus sp.]HMR53959.1 alpha/beta fold hydrolase [Amaricoccus sp.]HMR61476.1 alpha/beta fold hydrolase [Amaricoccus sp.]HMU00955.1 alpha/beta fold hydrolase [Amaricoccus sp.]
MSTGPAAHRIGQPSPLPFHLGTAALAYSQALMAAPLSDHERFPWHPHLAGSAAALGPDLDQTEVAREIAARLSATVAGLEIWQRHPYRRTLREPPVIWSEGSARLLDFGATPEATDPLGPPVLAVPSLINRSYILDLAPGRSVLRWLAAQGIRPLLLDWGEPGAEEAGFGLDDYGRRRLLPALRQVLEEGGRPVALMGYCMGGTLAAGAAARVPEGVARLVTIGAPWDFASTRGIAGSFRALIRSEGTERAERLLEGLGAAFGMVPVAFFQSLFALVNPMQAALKFQKLARMDPDGAAAMLFVALEDWLADGVPMPLPAARDLLIGWQIRNDTATGRWRFLGGEVDLRRVAAPALIFSGRGDTIAPPEIAEPLGRLIPEARILRPRTGHVGMVVGSAARATVLRPLAEFLSRRSG